MTHYIDCCGIIFLMDSESCERQHKQSQIGYSREKFFEFIFGLQKQQSSVRISHTHTQAKWLINNSEIPNTNAGFCKTFWKSNTAQYLWIHFCG